VGDPCRGRDNGFRPLPAPPRSLSDFRSASGVGGVRGRAVFATLDSINDAIITAIQLEGEQLPPRGGGLRGGSFRLTDQDSRLSLKRYAYVPGFRVTGTLRAGDSDITGRLTVTGPRGTSGVVTLTRGGGATGRLGGRPFTYRPRGGNGSAAIAGAHRVGLAPGPNLLRRLVHPGTRRLVP
jgi:hypothetical protein